MKPGELNNAGVAVTVPPTGAGNVLPETLLLQSVVEMSREIERLEALLVVAVAEIDRRGISFDTPDSAASSSGSPRITIFDRKFCRKVLPDAASGPTTRESDQRHHHNRPCTRGRAAANIVQCHDPGSTVRCSLAAKEFP
ncbi:hypothetical protein GS444_13345 [Rhodococcus hoagii]|nr:hypothetical protein [Prescottella equi]